MGNQSAPATVVDPACRVVGIEHLRVVDSSVFPTITNGNLNAPTIMLAERAADLILDKTPLAPIDVPVDGEDCVVGSARRDEVHQKGLRHRAVHVLIFDGGGQFFFQKRALYKESSSGLWDSSVAGHVDAGETYDQCCLREIAEEVGLVIEKVPMRLFKLSATPITDMEFSWIYRLDTVTPLVPDYTEMERGAWFSVNAIDQWIEKRPQEISTVF